MSAQSSHRGLLIAAVVADVALLTGTGAIIAPGASQPAIPANGAYGTISCAAPPLAGTTVDIRVIDAGDSMMGQVPMPATLLAGPTSVPSGKVSFVVADTGRSSTSW